jgi:hypothetical protein
MAKTEKTVGGKVDHITRTVSLQTYDMFQAWLPKIMADNKLRSLLFGLLNGGCRMTSDYIDKYGYSVIASVEWIAYQVDEHQAYLANVFVAVDYLERLKASLPPDWSMEWTDYAYTLGQARTVLLEPPQHVLDALDTDRLKQDKPRVYLRSGRQCNRKSQAIVYSELADIEKDYLSRAKNPMQSDILTYLHERTHREFSPQQQAEAFKYAEKLSPASARATKSKLAVIFDYTKPIYHPVAGCYRLYAPGLQFLQSSIREILFPTMLDVDLRSCHTAILASVLHLERTSQILADGESIWTYLLMTMDVCYPVSAYGDIKSVIKQAIYSICFGAGVRSVRHNFVTGLGNYGFSEKNVNHFWKSFKSVDMVEELLEGTTAWRKAMLRDKCVIDPFGVEQPVKTAAEARSACFSYCSALELKLIYPIYQAAREYPDRFSVLLHSHDGVMIKPGRRYSTQTTLDLLCKLVTDNAKSLGINTTLDVKN